MQPNRPSTSQPEPEPRIYPGWLFAAIGVAMILHLNYWLWGSDRLVFGLPINLFYHVVLTLALSVGMVALVRRCWPSFLEDEDRE